MKNNRLYTHIIVLASMIFCNSCHNDNNKDVENYCVSCNIDKTFNKDSATLYILEDDYQMLTNAGLKISKSNKFEWKGFISESKLAFIKFDNDSIPFYFIIGPNPVNITINRRSWMIEGGKSNQQYVHFLNQRQKLIDAQKQNFNNYLNISGNTSFTRGQENRYYQQDSILSDSIQRITLWRINQGDIVGKIIKERFVNSLSPQMRQKVK
ncbi:MAG: DUF4369 domain-containing protein [Bacteroidales bacterium]|nr:DUF4369 domain-containing protein [Candidatus Sodaliphilus aphodohippi]